MLLAEQINLLIIKRAPKPICDPCISSKLKLSSVSHAAQITAALGTTSDFDRVRGFCRFCGKHRVTIAAITVPSKPIASAASERDVSF